MELFGLFSYNVEEVASISGVSKQTVRRWLSGENEPHDRMMSIVFEEMIGNREDKEGMK